MYFLFIFFLEFSIKSFIQVREIAHPTMHTKNPLLLDICNT
jgi:hypothetical protein